MTLPGTLNKTFWLYVLKFIANFCILYYGTIAVIGIASPGGSYYSPFIDHYLDYVTWLRNSLMHASKVFLELLGYSATIILPTFIILKQNAVSVGYDCLGYGVTSFWIAFMIANKGSWKKKLLWILGGSIALWSINVFRISFLLLALTKNFRIPFFDQHTWFNIAAYLLIFLMIYGYDRTLKNYKL